MATDWLASEYGWTLDYIEHHVGFVDYIKLFKAATKRKNQEYLMQIAIARNPHTKNPDDLVKELQGNDLPDYVQNETLDKTAFARLKNKLSNSSNIIVK